MSNEDSVLKVDELDKGKEPENPYILDKQVQDFLEIADYLSKILSASDSISEILEFLDSEK
jgi:hypothetical protein